MALSPAASVGGVAHSPVPPRATAIHHFSLSTRSVLTFLLAVCAELTALSFAAPAAAVENHQRSARFRPRRS
ncbi:hypothetical protein DB30_05850 [Enhygromyxa salina]|uniref:Uncharacterized protein n=1 Tax=Enhygromyxa salina TaxID=215803 RepID=A0A0C2CZW6_9BACT|nr:hypothetical protein DB30_05850 [Enhygromyxa salina]